MIDLVNGDLFLGASTTPAAMAGYPTINVPAGYSFGLPVGISFIGTAWSEPTLIKLASGYEAVTHLRKPPEFLETLPLNGKTAVGINKSDPQAQKAALVQYTELGQLSLRFPGKYHKIT